MAFAVIAEIPGGTLKQYDAVAEAMGFNGSEETSRGLLVHFAGLAGDTLVVIDVWESRDAYQRHLTELGEAGREAVQKVGLPRPTRIASSRSTASSSDTPASSLAQRAPEHLPGVARRKRQDNSCAAAHQDRATQTCSGIDSVVCDGVVGVIPSKPRAPRLCRFTTLSCHHA